MTTVILDEEFAELLKADRAATGADRYDEVWEGTYMMFCLLDDPDGDRPSISVVDSQCNRTWTV